MTEGGQSQRKVAELAISKRMHELGFVGSAPHYFMDLPQQWLGITVNHGRGFAEPGESTFTADTWTASKAIMRVRGLDPNKRPKRSEAHSQLRIGAFLKPQFDKWWTTSDEMSDAELHEVVDSLTAAIEQALPKLKQKATDAALYDQLTEIVAGRPAPHRTGLLRDLKTGMADKAS